MKTLLTLLILAGFAHADLVTIAGQTSWGDTLRWGGSADSTSYLRVRGNAVARDSAGTWVTITTDSCSKPSRMERGSQKPIWKFELQYEVRSSATQTDSTVALFRFDTRYCGDPVRSLACDSWVPHRRHAGTLDVTIQDSVLTTATASGVTWLGTQNIFFPGGGSQLRGCLDGYGAGAQAGDSLFFRRIIVRYQ